MTSPGDFGARNDAFGQACPRGRHRYRALGAPVDVAAEPAGRA